MEPTENIDIAEEMRAHVARRYRTMEQAARHWGVSGSYVRLICIGKRPPTKTMLDEAGFEAVETPVHYRRKA